ncbi:MAG: ABC transporter ATP-binding protein, partial [Propionibacteriaceae bacterium]|nr:ABC transporter ATP-binding protein [Propionibacteriaceae bacterium]
MHTLPNRTGKRPACDGPALRVRHLAKSFQALQAVDDVCFDVRPGEVVSIIGPNGSGKSTTVNLIAGALRPDAGEVWFGGRRLGDADPVAVAEAGIARTFQNGRVFGSLSVADNVELGLHRVCSRLRPWRRIARVPVLRWAQLAAEVGVALVGGRPARREARELAKRVDAELEEFGERLAPRLADQAFTLSYANRRRTEIARAMASGPSLLLLDEPAAGMNPAETAELLDHLRGLKAQGQAILLVEHKMEVVVGVSDRVLVMDNGRIIAEGDPLVVRQDPLVV